MSAGQKILKDGFLVKKGHKRTNWRTRWFVLTEDSLAYYKQTTDSLPAGVIELKGCSVISPCLQYANKKGFAFMMMNQDRHELLMQASTDEEREAWAKAIGLAIVECDRSKEEVHPTSPHSKIDYHELVEAMKDPDAGIVRGKHKVDESTVYKDCFTGIQMIMWLMDWSFAETREKGIEIGTKLLSQALIQPMTCTLDNTARRKAFLDEEEALYRFSSLNMSNLKNVLDSSDSSSSDSDADERLPTCRKGREELPIKPLKGHGGKIVKQGFLLKRGHVRHTWKARLFVLWDDPAYLQYYRGSKAGDEKPLGEISLHKCTIGVQEAREKSDVTVKNKNRQNLFSVTTKKGKVYVFEARTPEEREDWMRAIISPLSVGRE